MTFQPIGQAASRVINKLDERHQWIALNGIESQSKRLQDSATDLARYVAMLARLPGYETRAEDEIANAEKLLAEAYAKVTALKVELASKRQLEEVA